MRLFIAFAPMLLLTACASDGSNRAGQEEDRLRADCEARGGYLRRTGATTGDPATENACIINSPTSRSTN